MDNNILHYVASAGKVFDWADLSKHTIELEDGSLFTDHVYGNELWLAPPLTIEDFVEVDEP